MHIVQFMGTLYAVGCQEYKYQAVHLANCILGKHVSQSDYETLLSVKFLNIQTPEKNAVIILNFEQGGYTIE